MIAASGSSVCISVRVPIIPGIMPITHAGQIQRMAKKCGATVRDFYWTLGNYDIVAIIDTDDDESITALGLSIAGRGNVRTQTMRAFTAAEMEKILKKMV